MKPFLTARWEKLIMANYIIDPKVLERYVPIGTEIDFWQGNTYVSLVGFMFLNTKVKGIPIPFHQNFEEVNLRFYVRFKEEGEWKRGVVFVKEIVPKFAIAFVANTLYGENYISVPMKHSWQELPEGLETSYSWKFKGEWNQIKVITEKTTQSITAGSEAEFITEHYWGYTKISKQKTGEYQVEHPKWKVYPVKNHDIQCNVDQLYGAEFAPFMQGAPSSIFMADGSDIIVREGRKLKM